MQLIPGSLIMKRWMKKARINVGGHLSSYNKENPSLRAQTYRHSSLMISVLEYVEMGDKNVERYKTALQPSEEGKKDMREANTSSDGMGLADRTAATATEEVVADAGDQFTLRAPKKKAERGKPSNKRYKPSYEGGSKRPRFCSQCRSDQHIKTSCPDRDKSTNVPRKPPTCTSCGLTGHTRASCGPTRQQLVAVDLLLV